MIFVLFYLTIFGHRSYLQVSVYWLCELALDAATGHALYVSGNAVFQQKFKAFFLL